MQMFFSFWDLAEGISHYGTAPPGIAPRTPAVAAMREDWRIEVREGRELRRRVRELMKSLSSGPARF